MDTTMRQKRQDGRLSFDEDRFRGEAMRRKEVSDNILEIIYQLVSVKERKREPPEDLV